MAQADMDRRQDVPQKALQAAPFALSDEDRWEAVIGRDGRFDGLFFYGVETTGIYCRPSCPARKPRRDRVSFHHSAGAAEAAGFRACLRCRPKDTPGPAKTARIAEACRLIEDASNPPALSELADAVGVSPHHLHRQFKATLGITPKAYAAMQRNARVRGALAGGATVTEALYEAGFNSAGRFYANAPEALGMPPQAFRAGGAGEEITFVAAACTLGTVLVAASSQGICAILLGDNPDDLRETLAQQFPRARLMEGPATFARTAAAVVSLVDGHTASLELPLDIRGTAFQRRVWEALRRIPPGNTATYSQIAAAIGAPSAARAVANACAANRLAVAIPCHRVVRADGSLSGYRWGEARKSTLLAKEANQEKPG